MTRAAGRRPTGRDAHRADAGMTVLELIVAMGVSSILLALIVSMFVTASRSFSDQQGAVENSRLASTSMNEVTRVIRAGTEIPRWNDPDNDPVFVYAGAEQVIMHSFIDAGTSPDAPPVRVQFARGSGNELMETRWAAHRVHTTYWAFDATPSSTRLIARSLTPATASTPLFRYYDKDGVALTPPVGGSLTVAQIRNVASVRVTMRVQADESGRVDPVSIQNVVGLPNLGVARVDVP